MVGCQSVNLLLNCCVFVWTHFTAHEQVGELYGTNCHFSYKQRGFLDFKDWSQKPIYSHEKGHLSHFHASKMPRLSRDERMRAVGMVQAGLSYSEVARQMACSQPTIRNLAERHNTTGSVNDRQRPGRERVTTPDQDRYIRLQHLRDRFRPASRTAR